MARLVEHAGGCVVGERAQAGLAGAQLLLGPPALRPVAEADADAAVIGEDVKLQVAPGAPDRFGLEGHGRARQENLLVAATQVGALGFGEHVPDDLVQHRLPGKAEIGFRRPVDVGEAPMRIEGVESVPDAFKDHAELGIDLRLDCTGQGLLQGVVQRSPRRSGDRSHKIASELLHVDGGSRGQVGHAHDVKHNHGFTA